AAPSRLLMKFIRSQVRSAGKEVRSSSAASSRSDAGSGQTRSITETASDIATRVSVVLEPDRLAPAEDRLDHAHRVDRLGNVVHAHDARSAQDAGGHRSQR